MGRLILLAVLACGFFGGCATLTETPREREARIDHAFSLNARQMVEDWDYIWLVDQPSSLTEKHIYTGMP